MSYNIRNIREISNEPLTKFTNSLAKKLAKFLNAQQQEKLENKEDIYSASEDVESVLRFHSLTSSKYFDPDTIYYPPFEPDLDKVKLWVKGRNMGSSTKDFSGYKNAIQIVGDPLLIDGSPFDYGINSGGIKSTAVRYNRPNSELDFLSVTDDARLRVSGITTGISYFARIRPQSLALQNGQVVSIYAKVDDSNNAAKIQITPSGEIEFHVRRAGTDYRNKTAAGTIVVGTVYDIWCTYANSGNTIKIYVNNVDKALSAGTTSISAESNFDARLMKRQPAEGSGYFYCDFYDFLIYREKVVSYNIAGSSVLFDGSNDYIECGNHSDLWSQSLTKFSLSFWIYPTAGWDANDRQVINHGGASNHAFRVFVDDITTGRIRFLIKDSTGSTKTSQADTLQLNQWNHITCVYDNSLGSANLKIYRNGVVGATTANLTESINISAGLRLSESSTDFQGYMKDFRWWTTKALNQTEINNIYADNISAPNPDYQLRLTEGSGTPTDVIGGTKTATLQNGASWVISEVGNHYTNKWTIYSIPFGQVMVTEYYSTYDATVLPPASFTSTSFTSTSFTT